MTPVFAPSSRGGAGCGDGFDDYRHLGILIAAALPYIAFSFVKGIDGRQPRAGVGGLEGQAARAYGAQLNGFETFPLFAAAVIVSHIVGGPTTAANVLAVIYCLLRVGHMAAYIADRQPLRSAAFTVAQLVAAAIFILPAFR